MANCPKCGKHLHIYNVSQYCPECGANIKFYGFEENFYREAKLAELSQAGMHVKLKHLKAAYIGSKLTIARLIVMLLPAVAFLLPAVTYTLNMPFSSVELGLDTANIHEFSLSIMGLVALFTGGGLNYINMMTSSVVAEPFIALRNVIIIYLIPIVFAVLVLLVSILCFISVKNIQKINCVLSLAGILSCVGTVAAIYLLAPEKKTELLSASTGYGLYLAALMFAVVFVVNFLIVKKGIPVEYAEGMEERVAIYKKYKAGEINLDDLPQPVVETQETRALEESIEKQEAELLIGVDKGE